MLSGFAFVPLTFRMRTATTSSCRRRMRTWDYLDWIKEMYDAGAVDPEFYLVTMYQDDDLWDAGKMGARYCNSVIEHLISYGPSREAFRAANPDATLVAGPALMKEGETVANVYYNPQIWGNYAISAGHQVPGRGAPLPRSGLHRRSQRAADVRRSGRHLRDL